jgi:hypothetical protein
MTRLWQAGFAIQGFLVVLISAGAYLGVLPTSLPAIPRVDLAGHALLFGLLAFFLDGALGYRPLWRGAAFPRLAPALVLTLAGVEEIAQRFSARRSSSLWDFAADVAGVCALSWLSRRLDEAVRARAARAC